MFDRVLNCIIYDNIVILLSYGSRYNLANQLGIDQATQYANYYDKMASTATQLGNLRSNPYSNAYSKSKASKAYKDVAKYAASTWDNPGVERDNQGLATRSCRRQVGHEQCAARRADAGTQAEAARGHHPAGLVR